MRLDVCGQQTACTYYFRGLETLSACAYVRVPIMCARVALAGIRRGRVRHKTPPAVKGICEEDLGEETSEGMCACATLHMMVKRWG